jgi:hypothetical protein
MTIVEEAKSIVNGDRAKEYGDVDESFTRIAALWSAYLSDTTIPWIVTIDKFDVAKLMILMKVSRAKDTNHRDSYVDIAGYVECVDKMLDPESLADDREKDSSFLDCKECLKDAAKIFSGDPRYNALPSDEVFNRCVHEFHEMHLKRIKCHSASQE